MISKNELAKIVGKENVSDAQAVLLKYSNDHSLVPPGVPDFVVWPTSSEQVSEILKLSNKNNVPVVPVSSQEHFNGGAIPKQGGIVMDLSKMNKILEIDEDLKKVRIEAGVTWGQLTGELAKKGMRVIMPLLPHANRSVLTDFLEREVPTNTVYDYGEPMQAFEVVWPTGDVFRLGSASVNGYPDSGSHGGNPSGPGIDFYRFVQGAQGTMGVVTWTNLKVMFGTKKDKVYFRPGRRSGLCPGIPVSASASQSRPGSRAAEPDRSGHHRCRKLSGGFRKTARNFAAMDFDHRGERFGAPSGRKDRLRSKASQGNREE